MKSSVEIYKGKRIFIARYDHMTLQELRSEVDEVKAYMSQNLTKEDMLVLVDTTGTIVSPEVLKLFKEMSANSSQYKTKTAIVGMSGPRKTFLDIVSKFSKASVVPFEDNETAKDWLIM